MKIKLENMEENQEYRYLSNSRKYNSFIYKRIKGVLYSRFDNAAKFEPSKITYNEVMLGQFIPNKKGK